MTEKKITYFFKHLGKETSLSDFRDIYDDQVEFKDPFNEVKSIKSVHGVFAHMYRNLDNPRFVIREYIAKDNIAYVKWVFSFSFKNESMQNAFEGVSRLKMNEEGSNTAHRLLGCGRAHVREDAIHRVVATQDQTKDPKKLIVCKIQKLLENVSPVIEKLP
jgi:hypothetical protein